MHHGRANYLTQDLTRFEEQQGLYSICQKPYDNKVTETNVIQLIVG